ncbi:MAG: VWA domain-containing protein [Acidobacteria bacterium]|nr:VWA domain-containing protein [Acidobacteriota bacterium]
MKTRRAVLLWVALFGVSLTVLSQDNATDETIKVDTALVSVPVIVSDRNGRYVPKLTAADFNIFQDGNKQNIEFFAATEEPLTIALLIDTSQSTRGVLGDIKDSAVSFIKLLAPADKAMIVSFNRDVEVLSSLTSDQEQLKKAVRSAEIPDGEFGTALRDAAYESVFRSFSGIKGRKAVILLTDGKDAGSRISIRELLYRLQESDTLVYPIMFKTDERRMIMRQILRRDDIFGGGFPGRRGGGSFPGGGRNGGGLPPRRDNGRQRERVERVERQNREASEFLQKIADHRRTVFTKVTTASSKKLFASIVEELRFQYRLGFLSSGRNRRKRLHEIRVKVRADTVVRSRSSYRVETK